MAGIGGTNMDNRGIDYRERSPLVVPPKLDSAAAGCRDRRPKIANWPKDPDEKRRKAAIARAQERAHQDPHTEDARPLTPTELNVGKTGAPHASDSDPSQPGNPLNNSILSPSQLGFNGSFSNLFGGNKPESAPFKGEPTRESLTQPPVGYQTPSPNFAYGTGPKDSLNRQYDPLADSVAGKYSCACLPASDASRHQRGVRCRELYPGRFASGSSLLENVRVSFRNTGATLLREHAPDRS